MTRTAATLLPLAAVPLPAAEPPPLFAHARGDIDVSFEFFPPKTEGMTDTLWSTLR